MRVVVEDDVFATPDGATELELFDLVKLAFTGRHRLVLAPEPDPGLCFAAWRDSLSASQRDCVDTALRTSLDAESRTPSRLGIWVKTGSAAARTRVPTFTLTEAVQLLHEPFRILVEDIVHDRAFLIAAACPEDRHAVIHAEDQHWLRFEYGGGLSGIRRLFDVTNPSGGLAHVHQRLRVFIVFDCDRLAPGAPSKKSDELAALCCEKDLDSPARYRRLVRRCIENYLPRRALEDWQRSSEGRNDRELTCDAWVRLRPEHAHYFNMKAGFRGDHKQLDALTRAGHKIPVFEEDALLFHEHYRDVPPEIRRRLLAGFDKNIGHDFHEEAVWYEQHPSWRHEAGIADEFDSLFRDLLGAL